MRSNETGNTRRTYTVNGKVYDRLEDVPEEFRSLLEDKDNDGMPDLFGSGKAGTVPDFSLGDGKKVVKGLFNVLMNPANFPDATSTPPANTFQKNEKTESSKIPTLLKIGFGIVIGLGIALVAINYLPSSNDEQTQNEDSTDQPTPEVTDTDESSAANVASSPDKMILQIEDPNVPPYKMFVNVLQGDAILKFDMPYGELAESSDQSLTVTTPGEQITNLSSQTINVTISEGDCTMSSDDGLSWDEKMVGEINFNHGTAEDSGAGQTYSTHYYSFIQNGNCITFSLVLQSFNATAVDPPVKEYDQTAKIKAMEDWLETITLLK